MMRFFWQTWLERVQRQDELGTVLWKAIDNNDVAAAKEALEAGVNVEYGRYSNEMDPPLLVASLQGRTEIVELLLKHGAAITTKHGSPLGEAAYHANIDIIRLLLQYGADPNEKYASGETPFDSAKKGKHPEMRKTVLKLLEEGQKT